MPSQSKNCGTAAADSSLGGSKLNSPTNAQGAQDFMYAQSVALSAGGYSQLCKCTNFGFTIPPNADILAIEVTAVVGIGFIA